MTGWQVNNIEISFNFLRVKRAVLAGVSGILIKTRRTFITQELMFPQNQKMDFHMSSGGGLAIKLKAL